MINRIMPMTDNNNFYCFFVLTCHHISMSSLIFVGSSLNNKHAVVLIRNQVRVLIRAFSYTNYQLKTNGIGIVFFFSVVFNKSLAKKRFSGH
jgi:hypothetical protein